MKRHLPLTIHKKRAIEKRKRVAVRHHTNIRVRNIALQSQMGFPISLKVKRPHYITLKAPKEICLYSETRRKKLVSFIKNLRNVTLTNNIRVKIDFSETNVCGASGMLLLFSEVYRICEISELTKIVSGININDETVRQVFKHTGFGPMLQIKDDISITDDNVRHWKCVTGEGTDSSIVGHLSEQFTTQIGEDVSSELFGAYVDAIDNVAGHAYIEPRCKNDKFKDKRWWMFAEIKDGKFITATCDLGIGIPRSLPAEGFREELLEYFSRFGIKRNDSTMIQAAFELNRTKTKNKKHGKGLKRMRKIVDIINDGHISIYSNSGLYTYSVSSNKAKKEQLITTKNIMGTIVEWNIPIASLESSINVIN